MGRSRPFGQHSSADMKGLPGMAQAQANATAPGNAPTSKVKVTLPASKKASRVPQPTAAKAGAPVATKTGK